MNSHQAIVEDFREVLTKQHSHDKAPDGFDNTLQQLAENDTLLQAFYGLKFHLLVAYLIVVGQKPNLNTPTPENLRQLLDKVSQIDVHESFGRLTEHTFSLSRRGPRRTGRLKKAGIEVENLLTNPVRPSKRPRLEQTTANIDDGPMSHDDSTGAPSPQGTSFGETTSVNHDTTRIPVFDLDPLYEYAWPKAKNLPFVFPPDTCRVIEKDGGCAALKISFAPQPNNCRLTFNICPVGVQNFVKELFQIHIRDEEQRRWIIHPNGTRMELHGKIVLRGAQPNAVEGLMESLVADGFRTSPRRIEELTMGLLLSDCLSVELGNTQNRCRVEIFLSVERLSEVYRTLWRP